MDFSEFDFIDPKDVLERLRTTFRDIAYSPPRLPALAIELLALTKKTDVEVGEVRRLLEQDQMLTAEVIRIAQSAAYAGQGEPIRTVGDALVRLGIQRTSDLFFQASLQMRVFRVEGYRRAMDELRRHSVTVAHVARLISRETSLYDEHAFLCGLLHDVGIAASLIAISESTQRKEKVPDFSQVWEPVREAHEEAGESLGKAWGLPEDVILVLKNHHHCIIGGYPHPTCCVIEVAGALVEEVGLGFGQESHPESVKKAMDGLALRPSDMTRIREKVSAFLVELA